jgi:hypothetical protein
VTPTRTPHDRLFQFLFAQARLAAAWARSVLPGEVATAVDWAAFTAAADGIVGPLLHLQRPDAVFATRTVDGGHDVLVLVEHKSWSDEDVSEQLLRYAVHLRRRAHRRGSPPPLVLPLLLQHGASVRAARPDLLPAALAAAQPRLGIVVDDLRATDEQALRDRGLPPLATLALLCLALPPQAGRTGTLDALDRWRDLFRAADADSGPPPPEDALAAICCYLADTTDLSLEELDMTIARNVIRDIAYPGTTGDRLRKQAFADGWTAGREDGRTEGRNEGRSEGRTEGRSEGRNEGRSEGMAAVLLRQLTRRFGPLAPEVVARLRSASPAQLEAWCERVLDAVDLAAVLADRG